ncbi:MAG: hypothetical protein IT371_15740 [Deltaproteobacteria bacterium]|nr:hypothetical protein [Deltaproteobacteria bacterium]
MKLAVFVILTLLAPVAQAAIAVQIEDPAYEGALAGDSVNVAARVTSTYQLQSVTLTVGGTTTAMTALYGRFHLTQSLVGQPFGLVALTVTATDVNGATGTAVRVVNHDTIPRVTINAPLEGTVARPALQVNVSCADDNHAGCSSIQIVAYEGSTRLGVVATGVATVNQSVSLAAYEGRKLRLEVDARDSTGRQALASTPNGLPQRTVYVESSAVLAEVESVGAPLWAVNESYSLWLEGTSCKRRARQTGQVDTIAPAYPANSSVVGLSPGGVIYNEAGVGAEKVYEWRPSGTATLAMNATALRLKGDYLIWSGPQQLVRRQLSTGTNTAPFGPRSYTVDMPDVGANGDVVFLYADPTQSNMDRVARYRAGAIVALSAAEAGRAPLTDGTLVVYERRNPLNANQSAVALHDGVTERILSAMRPTYTRAVSPGRDYQVREGWVAFTRADGMGALQIWVRNPAGQETQLSAFGSSSVLDGLGPNGQTTFFNSGRRYVGAPGSVARDIGAALGGFAMVNRQNADAEGSVWLGGVLHVVIGRTLFKVLASPATKLDGGTAKADASVVKIDGGVVKHDGASPQRDAGATGTDAGTVKRDGGAQVPDARAGARDGGVASIEAGLAATDGASSSADAGQADGSAAAGGQAEGGGGCSVGGDGRSIDALLALLALGLLATGRRRRG